MTRTFWRTLVIATAVLAFVYFCLGIDPFEWMH